MTDHSQPPHLFDIIEAIERINTVLAGYPQSTDIRGTNMRSLA
jgi:hypothetical protein